MKYESRIMIYDLRRIKKFKHSLKIENSRLQKPGTGGQVKLKILLVILISLILNLNSAPSARAQAGITVTPSIMHLDLASDAPEYALTYLNTTKTDINLILSVSDFNELEEGYKLNFLEGKDALNYKYSLSSWISFENKTIQLAPNEKKSVKVFIDKSRITKGGHYASIFAEIVQPDVNKQVAVKAILSSLLFVRASSGLEIENGKISSFTPIRDNIEYPNSYMLRFENRGNVHVVPYGLIEVYDSFGNLASKGILNEGSLDALPESIRRYDTKVTNYRKVLSPGLYTAKISIHFGNSNKQLSTSIKFFSQGSFNFIKIGLGIITLAILLFYFKKKVIIRKINKMN